MNFEYLLMILLFILVIAIIKKKIIIFDEQSEIYISNLFNKKEFITLKNLRSKINIYIILKLIFKFRKINSFNYFYETIKIIKPKYIFSFIDNNLIFYMLKEKFKDIKFISIQNGTRFVTGDILEKLDAIAKEEFSYGS